MSNLTEIMLEKNGLQSIRVTAQGTSANALDETYTFTAREPIVDELAKCRCRSRQRAADMETEALRVLAENGELRIRAEQLEGNIAQLLTWMADHGLVVPDLDDLEAAE